MALGRIRDRGAQERRIALRRFWPASPRVGRAGFTLVEVTLTSALLLALITSGLITLAVLNRSSARLADHTAAVAAVQGRLETIRAASYNPPQQPFYTAQVVSLTNSISLAISKSGDSFLVPGTIVSTITPSYAGTEPCHLVRVTGTFEARGNTLVISMETLVNRFTGGLQ